MKYRAAVTSAALTASLLSLTASPAAADAPRAEGTGTAAAAASCGGTVWKVGVKTRNFPFMGTDNTVYIDVYDKAAGYKLKRMMELDSSGNDFEEGAYGTYYLCQENGLVPWNNRYNVVITAYGSVEGGDQWGLESADVTNVTRGEGPWHYDCGGEILNPGHGEFFSAECKWVS